MIYPFVVRIYHGVTSGEDATKPRQANNHRLDPLRDRSYQTLGKKKPSPYSIPQTTVHGSRDRIAMIPDSAVDIEAGSDDTDSTRDTVWGSTSNNIRVVTKIGVRSSARPKTRIGQNAGAFWTDRP